MSEKLANHNSLHRIAIRFQGKRQSLAVEGSKFQKYHRLHELTKNHWEKQTKKNADHLDEILSSDDASLVLRPIVEKLQRGTIENIFSNHTIELCVITDPPLFNKVKV